MNPSLLSLSPPATPPHKHSPLLPAPTTATLPRSHSTNLSSSSSISRSNSTLSDSAESSVSSESEYSINPLPFPPTPPQSHHNTPLPNRRHRSITSLSNSSTTTTPPCPSKNDIFALSLPQPSLPLLLPTTTTEHKQNIATIHQQQQHLISCTSSYDQQDLIRLKTSLHLTINTNPSSRLGQGTHGTVHIAALHQLDHQTKPWKLCAAKISEDIPGSIKETLVLERLRSREHEEEEDQEETVTQEATGSENGSRFIVGWFGLKEDKECHWIKTPEENEKQRKRRTLSQSFLPPIVLALEYCPGGDLFKFVRRATALRNENHPQDKRLEVGSRRWLRWSQELAEALKWCKERHVLLGDLKPQNVLLTRDLRIKLSDFNRSTILSAEQSQGGLGLIDPQGTGTSVYAAPELVQPPPSPCSFPADIFALGITMYFLLTGREPYRGIQSAVERMLLISRGGFWEHELGMRWKMLEDVQSTLRPSSSTKLHKSPSRSNSTESHQSQSTQLRVSHNTVDALYGFQPDLEREANHRNLALEIEEEYPPADSDTRIGFYSDGSPMLRYLNGNQIVDERVMKLISKMCSPSANDRPQIDQIIQQLKST